MSIFMFYKVSFHVTLHLQKILYLFAYWVICMLLCLLSAADSFFKSTFSEKIFRNTIRVSNSLDPDQA